MPTPPKVHRTTPVPVQFLSIIAYTGFAIAVSIVAMVMFGIIGVLLAAALAWQWARIAAPGGQRPVEKAAEIVTHKTAATAPKHSGNQSFDRYRETLLARLEQEQSQFEGFLDRLRAAKDQHEFDDFMERRAEARRLPPETAEA